MIERAWCFQMRLRLLNGLVCGLTLLPLLLLPRAIDAQDDDPATRSLKGDWIVGYTDALLGPVRGRARMSEDESSVTVTLRHPTTGQDMVLKSRSVVRSGPGLTIVLEGQSPSGTPTDGLDLPDVPVIVPENTLTVVASYGDNTFEQPLNRRKPSDLDVVTLELKVTTSGALAGRWMYRADPVLWRDRLGRGRDGKYEEDENGIGIVWGGEAWRRPVPKIFGALVVDDQLKRDRGVPAFQHPFQPQSQDVGRNRTILVFGTDLPIEPLQPTNLKSLSDKIRYTRIWKPDDFRGSDYVGELFARGRKKLLESLPADKRARVADLDFIMLRAELQRGVIPGAHALSISDAEGAWILQFGDNAAQISFVRDIPASGPVRQGRTYESSVDFFYPEHLRVRVVTTVDLGVDSINVAVGVDGEVQTLGGESKIAATKVSGLKNTYISKPIRLVQGTANTAAKNPYEIPGSPGVALAGVIAEDGLISVPTSIAKATVHRSPATMEPGWLWKDYLRKAAAVKGDVAVENWYALSVQRTTEITNLVVFSLRKYRTEIKLGDHAAMLFLRDTFIEMMRAKEQDLGNLSSDAELMAFRHQVEPYVWDDRYALNDIKVTAPDGNRIAFAFTYLNANLSTRYKIDGQEQQQWVLAATREAIQEYRKSLAAGRQVAEKIPDDEIEDLLAFSGLAFGAVERVAKTRLVLLKDTPRRTDFNWTVDMLARSWMERIPGLYRKVQHEERLARSDTKSLLLAGAVVSLPVIMFGGTAGVVAGITFDVADLVYTAYDEIGFVNRRDDAIQFSKNSAEIIGPQRVLAARKLKGEWHKAALTIFFSASGVGMGANDFVDIFAVPLRMARIRRGAELMPAFERQGVGTLARSERRAVYTFLEEAHYLKATRKPMTDLQRRAIAAFDDLDVVKQLLNPRPRWATGLDRRTFQELNAIGGLRRPDLRRLMTRDGPEVVALLRGPNADLARHYLKWFPHDSVTTLKRQVERKASEISDLGENGPGFFRQCDMDDDFAQVLEALGWKFKLDGGNVSEGVARMTITDPSGKVGRLNRTYDPTNRSLSLDLAKRDLNGQGPVAGWISSGSRINLDPTGARPGLPTFTYAQFRMMNMFKIGYRNTGEHGLELIHMSTVINARTVAQLNWVAKTYYPGRSFEEIARSGGFTEALRHCRSVSYAESLANLAGFEARSIRLGTNLGMEATMQSTKAWYGGANVEKWEDFLKRFGLKESSPVQGWFDIDIAVRPRG